MKQTLLIFILMGASHLLQAQDHQACVAFRHQNLAYITKATELKTVEDFLDKDDLEVISLKIDRLSSTSADVYIEGQNFKEEVMSLKVSLEQECHSTNLIEK